MFCIIHVHFQYLSGVKWLSCACNFMPASSWNIVKRQNLWSIPQRIVFHCALKDKRLTLNSDVTVYIPKWIIKHAFAWRLCWLRVVSTSFFLHSYIYKSHKAVCLKCIILAIAAQRIKIYVHVYKRKTRKSMYAEKGKWQFHCGKSKDEC